ncbi:MAG: DUF4864 domain-containing protein, partial [Singulisphaera sp.]
MKRKMTLVVLALLLASPPVRGAGGADDPKDAPPSDVPAAPKPEHSPQEVVRIVLDALKKNDTPREDAGIETTFRFASAANKKVTGPLERFKTLVKNPRYRPMLNHKSARLGISLVDGNTATQRVTIIDADGKEAVYEFALSKDAETGCWMTDAVV